MKELKKQHLEMLQLLESIEVMLQNGNSIHPDSVIRGAIRIAIGMDQYGMPEGLDTPEKHEQYLKDIGLKKQTAVEWLVEKLSYSTSDGTIISHHKIINKLVEQAKEMEKDQIEMAHTCGGYGEKEAEEYFSETFKV